MRRIANSLPRTDEVLVRDRVKFRVGRIVYVALSRDETVLGFAFPKQARVSLVSGEPDLFLMPERADERYNWVQAYLGELDLARLEELVVDAWVMVVPKRVAASHLGAPGGPL